MLDKTAAAMKKLAASIQIAFVAPIEAASRPAITGPAISLHDDRLDSAPFRRQPLGPDEGGHRAATRSANSAPVCAAEPVIW